MIFHIVAQVKYAQSWKALFRAFSSHRQPLAIFFKGIPSCFFLLQNYEKTNRTQHVTFIFNVNQILYPN